MRRSVLARLAAAAVACVAVGAGAAALGEGYHHGRDQGPAPRDGSWRDRGHDERRYDRGDRWTERGGPAPRGGRDQRPGDWDDRRYNGYWAGGRWYYGVPQGPDWSGQDVRPGFVPWRRGAYLPQQYQSLVVPDYWRYQLRRPPYGYAWVHVGSEYLLISMATGLIFDVVRGN